MRTSVRSGRVKRLGARKGKKKKREKKKKKKNVNKWKARDPLMEKG